MARYRSEEEAAADGIRIEFEPEASRYAVYLGEGEDRRELGEAHYTLFGEAGSEGALINFDHTEVHPELRNTGVSGLLAEHAFRGELTEGRTIRASCSFMGGYLAKHPELAR